MSNPNFYFTTLGPNLSTHISFLICAKLTKDDGEAGDEEKKNKPFPTQSFKTRF